MHICQELGINNIQETNAKKNMGITFTDTSLGKSYSIYI